MEKFSIYMEKLHDIPSHLFIENNKPIGYLRHRPTNSVFSVYKKINWFQRIMIKLCFGLEYVKA